jgi:cyclic pyranopterin phosphate synthase
MALPVLPNHSDTRDVFERPMRDLRISVTDRCNFRCTFCMPAEREYTFLPRREVLSFEETARIARLFVEMGVKKIRITGGEPLVRADLPKLVEMLAAIEGVEDLALTTNGSLLTRHAKALKKAGLGRVTVSFHSLDPEVFGRLNGLGVDLQPVLDGLEAARAAGLTPIKLNVVPIRGVNEPEIVDIARWARERGYTVRFIEYMDVGTLNEWDPSAVLSAREIVDRIDAEMPLTPVAPAHRGEVARRYRYKGGPAGLTGPEVGVIPSITEPFCGDCTRVRLSAEGKVYTCLFAEDGTDLKAPLRDGADDGTLKEILADLWRQRTDRYSEERTAALQAGTFQPRGKVEMFRIGG